MRIDTNISNKFISRFNESRGIAINKKKVLKTRKSKTLSYIEIELLIFILLIVIGLLISFVDTLFSFIFYFLSAIYLVYVIANIILIYSYRRKQQFSNSILIDENGITDESFYGIKMIFKWDKVKGIVIAKKTITILTDTPVYFYLDISKKDDIINATKKYGNENKIIY